MPNWNPSGHALQESERKTITAQAVDDAREYAPRAWRYGLPSLDFKPIAEAATWAYLARRRQESTAFPRRVLRNAHVTQWSSEYMQWVGDCYYTAYLHTLAECIASGVRNFYGVPKSTPLPQGKRLSAEYLDALDADTGDNEDRRDWSGTHPTQEGAS